MKLDNITISSEMIKKAIASLDYIKTPVNFVHISCTFESKVKTEVLDLENELSFF